MGGSEAQTLEAEAFRRLYPERYLERFLERGVRPDGRPLQRARPASLAFDVVGTARASALAKLGSSTALAGVTCELTGVAAGEGDEGRLVTQVRVPLARRSLRARPLASLANAPSPPLSPSRRA